MLVFFLTDKSEPAEVETIHVDDCQGDEMQHQTVCSGYESRGTARRESDFVSAAFRGTE